MEPQLKAIFQERPDHEVALSGFDFTLGRVRSAAQITSTVPPAYLRLGKFIPEIANSGSKRAFLKWLGSSTTPPKPF
jgi:hypothetical protein